MWLFWCDQADDDDEGEWMMDWTTFKEPRIENEYICDLDTHIVMAYNDQGYTRYWWNGRTRNMQITMELQQVENNLYIKIFIREFVSWILLNLGRSMQT